MTQPRYNAAQHKAARQAIDTAQAQGITLTCVEPICLMPSRDIKPWMKADVCHDPTGTIITGPGHSRCNRSEGARRGNQMRTSKRRWAL